MKYDPLTPPEPGAWMDLDEGEQMLIVEEYHRARRIDLPNARLHAALHAVVESQAAMGDELPVAATLSRLMDEGLDRHEALHAVAAVLASHMAALQRGELPPTGDPNDAYFAELRKLTRQSWLDEWA